MQQTIPPAFETACQLMCLNSMVNIRQRVGSHEYLLLFPLQLFPCATISFHEEFCGRIAHTGVEVLRHYQTQNILQKSRHLLFLQISHFRCLTRHHCSPVFLCYLSSSGFSSDKSPSSTTSISLLSVQAHFKPSQNGYTSKQRQDRSHHRNQWLHSQRPRDASSHKGILHSRHIQASQQRCSTARRSLRTICRQSPHV